MVVHLPEQNSAWPALVGECNHFTFLLRKLLVYRRVRITIFIIANSSSFSILSDDRSKVSSKTIPSHSTI